MTTGTLTPPEQKIKDTQEKESPFKAWAKNFLDTKKRQQTEGKKEQVTQSTEALRNRKIIDELSVALSQSIEVILREHALRSSPSAQQNEETNRAVSEILANFKALKEKNPNNTQAIKEGIAEMINNFIEREDAVSIQAIINVLSRIRGK